MKFFDLPSTTIVNRVVPKNAFDTYINTKQKKQFTDNILRITWTNKLSAQTINLEAKDIKEIQIFKVELKQEVDIQKILEIINKSIPYHIVFWVEYKHKAYISTAAKHPHVINENIAVIDWTFTSDWFDVSEKSIQFNLKSSLDTVYKDLCVQITGNPDLSKRSFTSILEHQQMIDQLKKQIVKLKSSIAGSKEYSKKVEFNLQLKEKEKQLETLLSEN